MAPFLDLGQGLEGLVKGRDPLVLAAHKLLQIQTDIFVVIDHEYTRLHRIAFPMISPQTLGRSRTLEASVSAAATPVGYTISVIEATAESRPDAASANQNDTRRRSERLHCWVPV